MGNVKITQQSWSPKVCCACGVKIGNSGRNKYEFCRICFGIEILQNPYFIKTKNILETVRLVKQRLKKSILDGNEKH